MHASYTHEMYVSLLQLTNSYRVVNNTSYTEINGSSNLACGIVNCVALQCNFIINYSITICLYYKL